jgi:type IV pilus assembly protein PilQ
MKKLIIIAVLLTGFLSPLLSQDRFLKLQTKLEEMEDLNPGLSENVQMSVSGVSLQEFLGSLAETHQLNLSASVEITDKVSNNFSNAKVIDVLIFLCREYKLDLEFTGSIISLKKYLEPIVEVKKQDPKKPKVNYNNQTDFLSLDLKRDSIDVVAQEITSQSFKNVIISPSAKGMQVSVFIQNRPFTNALEMMCLANGLKLSNNGDNFYVIEKGETVVENNSISSGNKKDKTGTAKQDGNSNTFDLTVNDKGFISLRAENVPIKDIISTVSKELLVNYYIYTEPKGNVTLFVENATYDDLLTYILTGSEYTYKQQDFLYLIGERKQEGFRKAELIQLQNRPVENIMGLIPADIKKDVDLKEFLELNGIIATGSEIQIEEIKLFLAEIDKVVPMVMIEVMIIDINRSHTINTGVSMGIGQNPNSTTTNGSLSPGIDFDFSSESVNNLINGFNGLGLVNIGNVVPEFYMSLQALENNGNLKMRSTPRLSTLNGHSANIKIGNTEYYLEQNSNVYASNTPQTVITQNYKSVNADLSVTIKPFISSDNQVTLDIQVEQSDFTARVAPTAPPGSVTRTFKSMIRVKDGELIILGGLEQKTTENSASGLPGISRVPILRSIFGKNKKVKENSKLTILIKPVIIY